MFEDTLGRMNHNAFFSHRCTFNDVNMSIKFLSFLTLNCWARWQIFVWDNILQKWRLFWPTIWTWRDQWCISTCCYSTHLQCFAEGMCWDVISCVYIFFVYVCFLSLHFVWRKLQCVSMVGRATLTGETMMTSMNTFGNFSLVDHYLIIVLYLKVSAKKSSQKWFLTIPFIYLNNPLSGRRNVSNN